MDADRRLEPDALELAWLEMPSFTERAVLWHGDALVYYGGDEEHEFHPTRRQWEMFWDVLEGIRAWEWQPQYVDPAVLDGTGWRLTIAHAGRELRCFGANDFPPGFAVFRQAVSQLVGGRLPGGLADDPAELWRAAALGRQAVRPDRSPA